MPSLTNFLSVNGFIYTVRKSDYSCNTATVESVGVCKCTKIAEIYTRDELKPYLANSGFVELSQWWKMIKLFIKPGNSRYLYKVEVIK